MIHAHRCKSAISQPAIVLFALTAVAESVDAQPNIQFQPRPGFQNEPSSPCTSGPIRQNQWTLLGSIYTQENEKFDVFVNETTIQAMNYFTKSLIRSVTYLKVYIQFRSAEATTGDRTRDWSERVMLNGHGQFVRISSAGPMRQGDYVTEGALRQDVDAYLRTIPARSAYSMLEEHLRRARCF